MFNQRGNSLILGILIGLVVAGGLFAAYYLGLQKNPVTFLTASSPKPLIASPLPSSDPAVNWKTYTNPKYSFTIKYPQFWHTYTGITWNNDPSSDFAHVDLSPDTPPSSPVGGVPNGVRIFIDDPQGNLQYHLNKDNLSAVNLLKADSINPSSLQ